uniref:Uncharacterized protein n=1 Tax=Anguilla anguilla TaxID=7936 RepID=A0A0E9WA41_ANGAN
MNAVWSACQTLSSLLGSFLSPSRLLAALLLHLSLSLKCSGKRRKNSQVAASFTLSG